jgi:hypothetical protein
MKRTTWGFLAALLTTTPAISYFKYERQIGPASASGQHYVVVDETLWQHALPNLDDLRLYAAGKEIPYALRTMRGTKESEQKPVRLLQRGTVGGKTQFLLDMTGVPEYDRITLTLGAKNYVAHAKVEGQDDPHGKRWADLGTTTLFDLSDEKLGHNSTLQIPASTYKYLRVTLDGLVKPSDIRSGTAGIERAQEAVWRELNIEPKQTQEGKDTILTFSVLEKVPVERVMFSIDPAQGNFQREIQMQTGKGLTLRAGEISRIHIQRNGGKIDVDQTALTLSATSDGQLRAIIHNGDDAPLRITRARVQQYERRIYFDSDAGASLGLYYGDQKLEAPVYDYAKLFQSDARAGQVQMRAEEANSVYSGRPDDRPWSERHPAVLWAAILAAVAILGGIAVRSIKTASS